MNINKMPRIEDESISSSLHYALTDSQCNKCGAQLEWKADFNDINMPKYWANHCNQDYKITIDNVKIELVGQSVKQEQPQNFEGQTAENSVRKRELKENEDERQRLQQQPKAITMAEQLKDKALQKKVKLGDGSNIKAEDR